MVRALHDVIIPICLVVGPVLGYIPQYKEIRRTRNPGAFSPLVILILLVSNILRIFFWIEKRFEVALLLQSIVMIVAQLLLLELMVRLRSENIELTQESYTILGRDLGEFWRWNELNKYIWWLVLFSGTISALTFSNILLFRTAVFTEVIGTFALLVEATLAMPQLLQNHRKKTTRGLRIELVGAWALGDTAKTVLFVGRRAPMQFIVCGIVQLVVDFGIFYQMRIYRENGLAGSEYDAECVLASSALPLYSRDPAEFAPRSPNDSLSKSLDYFEAIDEAALPKRQSSLRTRSPAPFFKTM